MKVLFVLSGKSGNRRLTPFIKVQGDSLTRIGVNVEYFTIPSGIKGYLKSIFTLRAWLSKNAIDIIHAHYTLSGWVALLSFSGKPIVLSLMGSDAYGFYIAQNRVKPVSRLLTMATYLIQPFLNRIVSKSKTIEKFVYRKNVSHIIPNGVNLTPIADTQQVSRIDLNLINEKKYVLFLGNPGNPRKNYSLAVEAVKRLKDPRVELLNPFPVNHKMVFKYLHAADVLIMCSYMEGSPNVIKEAMACNCPIVSTDVGDVSWLLEGVPGCYISSFDSGDFSGLIAKALRYSEESGPTNGRDRLIELGLESEKVASKLKTLYQDLI